MTNKPISAKKIPTTDPWVGTWRPHERRGPIAALHGSPGPKHGLPSLTGRSNHDPTKHKAPAFSLGLPRDQPKAQCSPGPKYLAPSNVTRTGRDGTPAFSLTSRRKDPAIAKGPGPGHYAPEKAGKCVFPTTPAYSMSGRKKDLKTTKTPGPAAYCVPPVLGAKNVTKPSAPAVSMNGRGKRGCGNDDLQKTPGPAAYGAVDLSKYKPKPPQFTLTCRRPASNDNTKKPGPGAHYPEKVTVTKKAAPSVSFGLRHSQYTTRLVLPND